MRLKESDGREDIEDLARIKEDLGTGRQQLFLRCMVIATAILVLIGAVVALML